MKVVCIHIPRSEGSTASAIYETSWSITNSRLFMYLLDDFTETVSEEFSLEYYCTENIIYVCMRASDSVLKYLINGVYTILPNAEIKEIEDYTYNVNEDTIAVSCEARLGKAEVYPLQNFSEFSFNSVSPIYNALSTLPPGDRGLVQVICKPLKNTTWLHFDLLTTRKTEAFAKKFRIVTHLKGDLKRHEDGFKGITKGWDDVLKKCNSKLFAVNYRVFSMTQAKEGEDPKEAEKRISHHAKEIANATKVYTANGGNKIRVTPIETGKNVIKLMQQRTPRAPFKLSTMELTTMWHPPSLGTLPNTAQVLSAKSSPPKNLPMTKGDPQISFYAHTNYRDQYYPFGMKRFDRRKHFYMIGKSGSGKSYLLQLLIKNDIDSGFGCAVIDPHGDLADDILKLIPKHRVKDVVLFDPSDVNFPPSFNPIGALRPDLRTRVTIGFLDTFKRVFSSDWSDKMDHVLRYSMMALLSVPGSSIVSLRKLLADDDFRDSVVKRATDESVKRFWEHEFQSKRTEFIQGAISPILNRIDQLLSTDMIRNILGQPVNLFNFREFMDNRKIVLMKISKGVLGLENSTLIGSLLITKIYEAAMSRADIPQEQRQDFYFYIDEFQNFANESFSEILSESRKYRLCLTLANQYLGQLDSSIRQTIFGNVGNFLSFRVGSDDSSAIASEFKPKFGELDLLNLGTREFYQKMTVDGEVQEAFSGRTLELKHPPEGQHFAKECIEASRAKYSIPVKKALETLRSAEGNRTGNKPTGGFTTL